MRYLLIIGAFYSGLFAHAGSSEHLHIFSSMHLESFALLLTGLITTYFIYKKIVRRDS